MNTFIAAVSIAVFVVVPKPAFASACPDADAAWAQSKAFIEASNVQNDKNGLAALKISSMYVDCGRELKRERKWESSAYVVLLGASFRQIAALSFHNAAMNSANSFDRYENEAILTIHRAIDLADTVRNTRTRASALATDYAVDWRAQLKRWTLE